MQLFGNLSRSYEPPTFDELVGTEVTTNINTSPKRLFAITLDKQTATTLEVGSKGRLARFSWNVAAYRSWVRNEILEVKDYVRGIKRTENYPQTLHQGVEVGLNAVVADRPWGINVGKLTLVGYIIIATFVLVVANTRANALRVFPNITSTPRPNSNIRAVLVLQRNWNGNLATRPSTIPTPCFNLLIACGTYVPPTP